MRPVVTIGLSVLAGATELVVIRGDAARGTVIDRAITETHEGSAAKGTRLQQTIENVLQTRALAIAHGYHVHAVGVTCDGANAMITDRLIVALKDAGLDNVSALDSVVARELFTQPESAAPDEVAIRARGRRRWFFVAAMVIALAASTFAIVDRWEASHSRPPQQPAVTPPARTTTVPQSPVVEAPPPVAPTQEAPPPAPTQEPSEPPTPTDSPPPRRAPVQQQPAERPSPATPPPPAEAPGPEPAPADNCMFLCGVTL
jgi:hypothetical protein